MKNQPIKFFFDDGTLAIITQGENAGCTSDCQVFDNEGKLLYTAYYLAAHNKLFREFASSQRSALYLKDCKAVLSIAEGQEGYYRDIKKEGQKDLAKMALELILITAMVASAIAMVWLFFSDEASADFWTWAMIAGASYVVHLMFFGYKNHKESNEHDYTLR